MFIHTVKPYMTTNPTPATSEPVRIITPPTDIESQPIYTPNQVLADRSIPLPDTSTDDKLDIYYTGVYNDFGCTRYILNSMMITLCITCIITFILSFIFVYVSLILFCIAYICLLLLCICLLVYIWTNRYRILGQR